MPPKKPPVYAVSAKVFAKVRGYPAWPARVEAVNDAKATKYQVFFYGTYESATVKKDELWPFNDETKKKFGEKVLPLLVLLGQGQGQGQGQGLGGGPGFAHGTRGEFELYLFPIRGEV
jgi:hypothetical protein